MDSDELSSPPFVEVQLEQQPWERDLCRDVASDSDRADGGLGFEDDFKFETPSNLYSLHRRVDQASTHVKKAMAELRTQNDRDEDYSKYADSLTYVQNGLWVLLGFLFQLKSTALEFILATNIGHKSYAHFKDVLSDSMLKLEESRGMLGLQPSASIPPDALTSYTTALDIVHKLHCDLVACSSTFDDFLRIPSSLFVTALGENPHFNTYSRNLLVVPETPVAPDAVVDVGKKLEPVYAEFGKLWVKKHVSSETPSLSTLQSVQVKLLEHVSRFMDNQSIKENKLLDDIRYRLSKEVVRANSRKFVVAFCGMVKSGKSLFLNALIGRQILPTDELPATAWPCRLRHVPGSSRPHLSVNSSCFKIPLDNLRERRIGHTMSMYRPPEDYLAALANGESTENNLEDGRTTGTRAMYHVWEGLHRSSKRSLVDFENPSYQLPDEANGDGDVMELLGKVNDLVRLCRAFNIDLPEALPDTWLVLSLDIAASKKFNTEQEVELEFIDLPGVGEANNENLKFEDLVRIAAREANSVVPIISLREVAKDEWRKQLTSIIKSGLGRAPDRVLCTHLDKFRVSDVRDKFIPSVGSEFWPSLAKFDERVLYCSPRLGIGAQDLLDLSTHDKPTFDTIWNGHPIRNECAKNILGANDPEFEYSDLSHEDWIDELKEQLSDSELPSAVSRLIKGIISSTRTFALKVEGKKLVHIVERLIHEQRRSLTEISRSERDFRTAYETFLQVQEKMETLRSSCAVKSGTIHTSSLKTLNQGYAILEQDGKKAAVNAVEFAAKAVEHTIFMPRDGHNDVPSNQMVLSDKFSVEKFYYTAQEQMTAELKNNVIRTFVTFSRELSNRSRAQLFDYLVTELESSIKDIGALPTELVEDILGKLSYEAETVEVLFSPKLKNKIIRIDKERHNMSTAYSAIKEVISRPFKSSGSTTNGPENHGELGFMYRAPVAVLATIPLVLGTPFWPFITHKKTFIVDKDVLVKYFQEQSLKPFFSALRVEAETTLDAIIGKSLFLMLDIVAGALADENARFEREKLLKTLSVQDTITLAINTASLLWNLSAVESGLTYLQFLLKDY